MKRGQEEGEEKMIKQRKNGSTGVFGKKGIRKEEKKKKTISYINANIET